MNLEKTCSLIEVHEDYIQCAYLDSLGNVTIGIGDNLGNQGITTLEQANAKYPNGVSLEDARDKAKKTINKIFNSLPYYIVIFKDLDDVRQAVLIDMAFNMGVNGLLKFKATLAAINAEDWESASKDMLNSLWASQVQTRATSLAKMMLTGEWPPYV